MKSLSILASSFTLTTSLTTSLAHEGHDHSHQAPPEAASLTHAVTTGSGSETYRSVPGWCQLPDGKPLGNTHGGIVIDRKGQVYFNTDTKRSIMVYSSEGSFLRAFGENHVGIHDMTLNTEDGTEYLYAAHLGGKKIVKFTLEGEVVWEIDGPPALSNLYEAGDQHYNPTGVAVAPNGDVYVADGYGLNYIHQYTKDQTYVRSFGGRGTEPGKFKTCHGVSLDTRGETPLLLISDRENRRLQHFDLEGNFVSIVATGLRRPCAVSIWNNHVAVAELAGRVTILDATNHPIAFLGDNPNKAQWAKNPVPMSDWKEGVFTAPHGCCYDAYGNIYVMDWNRTGRISRLDRAYPALASRGQNDPR